MTMESNNQLKEIHIKHCTNYFYNDIINIKNVDPNRIKTDEKSYIIFLFTTLDM